ncbi:hypothetical protein P691DRAFT_522777 [Macrolepiota fuliginosa MF-IS2]|uniref:Mtf2-like C-terminal domain-containing protein n=1 Tax=Macrolepiota fuliginosa MF-IS2 TaxID=1400762 RepID=A0A9P6C9F2_9AGAR|nr:hypothetical protein P691DRAFT_522777 [Macrolepiota fuliginosa MF-IS2]
MTAQEQKTFTDLFDEIFRVAESVDASGSGEGEGADADEDIRAFSSDFYDRIRRMPRKPKWGEDPNEELDRKQEEMDLCQTDQELLDWALVEVFAESQRFEQGARELGPQTRTKRNVTLQPSWYPHTIALLMRTFRDKYHNPHTALAIFNHAKTASIASYAFGCSTDAYNELIKTHWSCFRDANAVLNALKEMHVNGVVMNSKTGRLLDTIRRDVGAEMLWSDEEVSNITTRLDAIRRDAEGFENASKKFKGKHKWDQWKSRTMRDDPSDKWGFNNWDNSSTGRAGLT